MDDIVTYFPAPDAHGPIALANGETVRIDESGEPAFFIFKTLSDAFVGRLSFIKVISGVIEPGQELINATTGKKERIAHIYVMTGKETDDVKSAKAGDIVVIPKLSERTLANLSTSGTLAIALTVPKPLYPVAIETANKKDED